MFIKSKKHGNKFVFYLIQSKRIGKKVGQFSLYLGDSLEMTALQWSNRLARAKGFCPSIREVAPLVERYARRHNLQWDLAGLAEAMRIESLRSRPSSAHRVLGLLPHATQGQIKTAFRKLSHLHHPDLGGDAAEFRKLVRARDLLLYPYNPSNRTLQDPK